MRSASGAKNAIANARSQMDVDVLRSGWAITSFHPEHLESVGV